MIVAVVFALVGFLLGLVALIQVQQMRLELQRLKGRLRKRRSSEREGSFPEGDSFFRQ